MARSISISFMSAWRGSHLLDARVGNQQVRLVGTARLGCLFECLESGVDAQHLRDGMDDEAPLGVATSKRS